jgi:hypothetical protein
MFMRSRCVTNVALAELGDPIRAQGAHSSLTI